MSAEIEHEIKVIPIDQNLQGEVAKLEAGGWELMPGVPPVAVYHIIRNKARLQQQAAQSGVGLMGVDDTKVHILRDGKLVVN